MSRPPASTFIAADRHWMRRALHVAAQGFTPPNPMVGCVLVRDGQCVGEGFHPVAGQPHAEIFALRNAADTARGATAYVTLEPCSHWGRTPPCVDALIAAGVARVVACAVDPDPRVSGAGLDCLRAAGIEVSVGLLEDEAREQNAAFFHFHATGTPFVTIKAAMTLDGKIATHEGDSRWITGERARRWVHRLRAQSGAVMVGIGTLLADDARLTARLRIAPPRQPLRVVVDSHLRTPISAAALQADTTPLLIAAIEAADPAREAALLAVGAEVLRVPANREGRVDLTALLTLLAARQTISVLVEGGGELAASFIERDLAQRAIFIIAPKIIGGRHAPTPVEGGGHARMDQALATGRLHVRRLGADIAITTRL